MFVSDTRKAIINYEKPGVSFEEAATIFADPDGLDWPVGGFSSFHSGDKIQAYREFYRAEYIACRVHNKESKPWPRSDQDHQRAAGKP
jgi:uncharacterized DUF497 family protein